MSAVFLPARTVQSGARRGAFAVAARRFRSLFKIDPREASLQVRGFAASTDARQRLEDIGAAFLFGFNHALIEDQPEALQRAIERIDLDRRGFAVEGAAMGGAVADALMLGGSRLASWMRYNNSAYTYLAHVGAGWALARVPWRRASILRSCDPVHGWLAFDGLGFHDVYFTSEKVFGGWRRVRQQYAARVYDQGVGRALWFAAGADIDRAIALIARFEPARHSDLWSGLGLAMAYAGGAPADALAAAVAAAGGFRADLAQGAAFAAEAHARANHVPAHSRDAVACLTGRDAAAAAELVRALRARLDTSGSADAPAYERWRCAVRQALSAR